MRRVAAIAAIAVAVVAVALVLSSGDDRYDVRVELANAGGLYEGAPVRMGGVQAGVVSSLDIREDDTVVLDLELDDAAAPLGRGARAEVRSANLLGQKFIALQAGDTSKPQPSGHVIRRERTAIATDLDEVLAVLDADTRTRLGVLVNEAGLALTGRRADFNSALEQLPGSVAAATRMLEQLAADNRALGRFVTRGDTLVTRLAAERRALGRLTSAAGEAMQSIAPRRERLRATLARAPRTLASLRRLLGDVRRATRPLGPAAKALRSSASPLRATLRDAQPFERAASPALGKARSLVPQLDDLAADGTPVVRAARRPVQELAEMSQASRSATRALDVGVEDLLAWVEAVARSTQDADGIGHYWRAKAILSSEIVESFANILGVKVPKRRGERGADRRRPARPAAPKVPPLLPAPDAARPRPEAPKLPLQSALDELVDALKPSSSPKTPESSERLEPLLDFLLR